jgi:hypothetical protein
VERWEAATGGNAGPTVRRGITVKRGIYQIPPMLEDWLHAYEDVWSPSSLLSLSGMSRIKVRKPDRVRTEEVVYGEKKRNIEGRGEITYRGLGSPWGDTIARSVIMVASKSTARAW